MRQGPFPYRVTPQTVSVERRTSISRISCMCDVVSLARPSPAAMILRGLTQPEWFVFDATSHPPPPSPRKQRGRDGALSRDPSHTKPCTNESHHWVTIVRLGSLQRGQIKQLAVSALRVPFVVGWTEEKETTCLEGSL